MASSTRLMAEKSILRQKDDKNSKESLSSSSSKPRKAHSGHSLLIV
jgi:hypothetical protein